MALFTFYLPADIEKQVRARAKAEGTTVNRWISTQIARVVERSWSPEFLAAAGAAPDLGVFERFDYPPDSPRDALD